MYFVLFCSNKPNPNQISVSNGKMTTMNGAAGPGGYHAANGGRACESCFGKYLVTFFQLNTISRLPTVHLKHAMPFKTEHFVSQSIKKAIPFFIKLT